MSHYDDLGVARDASPEEIREAYRILVRLLHPDQQTDPVLNRAAEGQMRRINTSYAVLSDPEQRRLYDREAFEPAPLRNPASVAPGPMMLRRPIRPGSLVWVAVAALSLGAIFWLAIQGQEPGVHPAATHRGFAGTWTYQPSRDSAGEPEKYPPQFIEASIAEKDGRIHGKYLARYQASGQPDVSFEFEGSASGNSAKLPWHGDGGSQGQVQITMNSENQMEVIWHATDPVSSPGLESGAAILVRRPD